VEAIMGLIYINSAKTIILSCIVTVTDSCDKITKNDGPKLTALAA